MTQEDSERFNGQVGRLAPRRFATRVFVFFFFLERARKVNGEDHVAMQNACL